MIYLKTFEGFGHLDFDNSLFKQIDYENFEEMVSSQSEEKSCVSEEITDKDAEWFTNLIERNIFEPFSIGSKVEKVKRLGTDKIESVVRVKLLPKFNNDWTEILLYKFEDEYWVVECMGFANVYFDGGSDWTYWACDTTKGVEEWCKYYFENIKEWLPPVTESVSNDPLYYNMNDLNPDEKEIVSVDKSVVNTIQNRLLPGFEIERKQYGSALDMYTKKVTEYYVITLPNREYPDCLRDFYVDIFQLDDEWFDVEYLDARDKSYGRTMFNSHYYRCDGVEGLLQFLQDENIIE